MNIIAASPDHAEALSRISFAAKSHWGYASDVLVSWKSDLTITSDSIRLNRTCLAIEDNKVMGFYQLSVEESLIELEHLWVLPEHMGKGVGRALLQHAQSHANAPLHINSDPYAEAFYLACGAIRVACIPAPIPGQPHRFLPRMELPYIATW